MNIEWSQTASNQLDGLRAGDAGGPANSALAGRIARKVNDLATFPLLGSEVADYADAALREVLEPPYRLLYRVTDDGVRVVALWHSARRLPRTPPG